MDNNQLVEGCLKGVIFESWLRFLFLEEDGGKVCYAISPDWLAEIEKLDASLRVIALGLNGKALELETSRKLILEYMRDFLQKNSSLELAEILSCGEFQKSLEQYQEWLGSNEDFLPVMEFSKWLSLFHKWQAARKNL